MASLRQSLAVAWVMFSTKGKVATLACGYQGSTGALIQMGALKRPSP